MRSEEDREKVLALVEEGKGHIVDGVADMISLLNEGKIADAALVANALSDSLMYFAAGLAAEALVRKMENPPTK